MPYRHVLSGARRLLRPTGDASGASEPCRQDFVAAGLVPKTSKEETWALVKRTPGPRATLVGAVLMWLGVVIVAGAHAPPPQDNAVAPSKPPQRPSRAPLPQPASPSTANAGEYVGEEKCLECHEDQGKGYHDTPHGRAKNPRTPAAKNTCETCHGPGKAHVDADGDGHIKDFKTMAPRQVGETCTTCHARSEHNNWAGSKHDSRNMSCTTCHSVHEPKSEKAQLKKADRHRDLRAVPQDRK